MERTPKTRRLLRRIHSRAAVAEDSLHQGPGQEPEAERQTLHEVPPEQSTRLVYKTVNPLETDALQGGGRARLVTRKEAERYPDADEPGLGHL